MFLFLFYCDIWDLWLVMEPHLMFRCSFWFFFEVFNVSMLLSGDLSFMKVLFINDIVAIKPHNNTRKQSA